MSLFLHSCITMTSLVSCKTGQRDCMKAQLDFPLAYVLSKLFQAYEKEINLVSQCQCLCILPVNEIFHCACFCQGVFTKQTKPLNTKYIRGLVCKETMVLRRWGVETNVWFKFKCLVINLKEIVKRFECSRTQISLRWPIYRWLSTLLLIQTFLNLNKNWKLLMHKTMF